jgi:predicted NAD/FAD-binding protein
MTTLLFMMIRDIFKNYDEIIFASPADQVLQIIENSSEKALSILSNFTYQPNRIVARK